MPGANQSSVTGNEVAQGDQHRILRRMERLSKFFKSRNFAKFSEYLKIIPGRRNGTDDDPNSGIPEKERVSVELRTSSKSFLFFDKMGGLQDF